MIEKCKIVVKKVGLEIKEELKSINCNPEEFYEVLFDKPILPTSKLFLKIFLLLGVRKGNKLIAINNSIIGLILHKDDLKDLKRLVEQK